MTMFESNMDVQMFDHFDHVYGDLQDVHVIPDPVDITDLSKEDIKSSFDLMNGWHYMMYKRIRAYIFISSLDIGYEGGIILHCNRAGVDKVFYITDDSDMIGKYKDFTCLYRKILIPDWLKYDARNRLRK